MISGTSIDKEYVGRREGDPPVLVASSDKARDVLGWVPQYTEIGDIISSAWEFYKNHVNGYTS